MDNIQSDVKSFMAACLSCTLPFLGYALAQTAVGAILMYCMPVLCLLGIAVSIYGIHQSRLHSNMFGSNMLSRMGMVFCVLGCFVNAIMFILIGVMGLVIESGF